MKKARNIATILFAAELIFVIFIPFIVWWRITPTNVLNSNSMFKLLESVGLTGSSLILFAGIPVGLIGVIKAKKLENLRTLTIVLSIINLSAGIIEVGLLVLIFCMAVFGGISV